MTAMNTSVSRRSFLLNSCAVTAYATLPAILVGTSPVAAAPRGDNIENVSFAGSNKIQLTIVENALTDPVRVPVAEPGQVRTRPTNNIRHRGFSDVGGVTGFVSGSFHATAPQLFRPLAEVIPEAKLAAFDGEDPLIDQPQSWTVRVGDTDLTPVTIYRKSVPIKTERTGLNDYAHSLRHLITLELAASVPQGGAVTVTYTGLGNISAERDPTNLSEIIHVCQLGYPTEGLKKAYVGLWLGHSRSGRSGNTDDDVSTGTSWTVIDTATNKAAISGTLELVKAGDEVHMQDQNFNGCDVYEADFSALATTGTFRIQVEGVGSSYTFDVTDNPYHECFRAAARWYFHQRSGIAIDAEYGEGRMRPRNGHPDDGLKVWQSDVLLGQTREGFTTGNANEMVRATPRLGLMDETAEGFPVGSEHPHAWGGWHDAGDWDRRIQHMDAVFVMANLVELFASVREIDLNIPESGKTFADAGVMAKKSVDDTGDGSTVLPDLIHEALWGISLWRRTQSRDGGIIGGVEYSSDGISGSVSWNPHQHAFAYTTEPWASYRFAAAASKLGHVISDTVGDKILGGQLIEEAVAAWTWAETKWPAMVRASSTASDAEFDPADASDVPSSVFRARIAAAASVYRASGAPEARAIFEAHNAFLPQSELGGFSARRGVYSDESFEYLRAASDGLGTIEALVESMRGWAGWLANGQDRMGQDYGLHSTATYPWGRGWARFGPGSNWRASELALHFTTGSPPVTEMRDKVVEGLWFALGCNPSNVSFVQGFGSRQFGDPAGSDYRGIPKVPGHIAFGVIMGEMYPWEKDRTTGALYPEDQSDWPVYAQIFESSVVNTAAEHGMKANAMEWLFANGFAQELIARV